MQVNPFSELGDCIKGRLQYDCGSLKNALNKWSVLIGTDTEMGGDKDSTSDAQASEGELTGEGKRVRQPLHEPCTGFAFANLSLDRTSQNCWV